jgi:adenylosuccinate lyase
MGVAFGHSLFAYHRASKGLSKLGVDTVRMQADLAAHPEVLAEAVQTILRREGYPEPYEALKRFTRGRAMTLADLHAFIDSLEVSDAIKAELHALTPEGYTGLADKLARTLVKRFG